MHTLGRNLLLKGTRGVWFLKKLFIFFQTGFFLSELGKINCLLEGNKFILAGNVC